MESTSGKKLKFGVSFVTISTVLCAIVHFVFSVFARKYVPVADYGLFTSCGLLSTYMNYLQIGVINSLNRDYPQFIGAGNFRKARQIKNNAISFLCVVYGISILAVEAFLFLLFYGDMLTYKRFYGLILMAPTAFLAVLESVFLINARMDGHFNLSGVVTLIKTLISIIIGLIFIRYTGYYGLFIAAPLASFITILLLSRTVLSGFRFELDKSTIKNLVITGIPLLINSFAWTVVTSIDKFVILTFMDEEALGFYSIALLGFSTIAIVPNTISQLLYIKMGETYGKEKSIQILIDKTNYFSKWLSFSTGGTVLVSFYLLPIFVEFVMPQYDYGIVAAQIMMIGVAMYSSSILYSNIFSILKMNGRLIGATIGLCFFNISISSFLVVLRNDINMVAIGTALSYALYALLVLLILKKATNIKILLAIKSSWASIVVSLIPCVFFTFLGFNLWFGFIISLIIYGIYSISFIFKGGRIHV